LNNKVFKNCLLSFDKLTGIIHGYNEICKCVGLNSTYLGEYKGEKLKMSDFCSDLTNPENITKMKENSNEILDFKINRLFLSNFKMSMARVDSEEKNIAELVSPLLKANSE